MYLILFSISLLFSKISLFLPFSLSLKGTISPFSFKIQTNFKSFFNSSVCKPSGSL